MAPKSPGSMKRWTEDVALRKNSPATRCCPKPRTDFTLITRKPRLESGPLVPTATGFSIESPIGIIRVCLANDGRRPI